MNLHQVSKRKQGEFFYLHTEPIRFLFKIRKIKESNLHYTELKGLCDRVRRCTIIGVHLNYSRWYIEKSEEI